MTGESVETTRSYRAWEIAKRQQGVVTRRDLLRIGFSSSAIEHRLATGRLHPIMRGVYSVGWPVMTRRQQWMAAVLASGDFACLSHRSAGALWGIADDLPARIDVSVRRHSNLRRPGLRIRVRCGLSRHDVTRPDGIPVTIPARTLLDLATELNLYRLERAISEADKRDLIDPESLRAALAGYAGQPGVRALRTVLDRHTFLLSDSQLEVLFRPIAAAAGLPPPLTKQDVNGFEVDFFWPNLGLVVETDGLRYHRTPSAQSRDALRDQTHTASGLTPLRFSHWQVKYEPDHVKGILSRTCRRLGATPEG